MVLGKLPVPGCPTNLDYSGAKDLNRLQWVQVAVVWTFFSLVYHFFFFLLLSGRRPDIDCNTVSKGPLG